MEKTKITTSCIHYDSIKRSKSSSSSNQSVVTTGTTGVVAIDVIARLPEDSGDLEAGARLDAIFLLNGLGGGRGDWGTLLRTTSEPKETDRRIAGMQAVFLPRAKSIKSQELCASKHKSASGRHSSDKGQRVQQLSSSLEDIILTVG